MLKEPTKYKILIVDDETANLRLLERLFGNSYEVFTAASGPAALELLAVHEISLIISDQRMPGMTGIEFLKRAAELRPQTVRIMLTGYSDAEALVTAINSGAVYKYITKPWVNEELLQSAKRALQHYETTKAQRQLQVTNERLQSRLRSTKEKILELVGVLLREIDDGDPERAARVGERALRLARTAELDRFGIESIAAAGFLYFAASKLSSAQTHTDRESGRVSNSIEDSFRILSRSSEFEEVFTMLSFREERFDGSGGPNGFRGDEIPLAARILAVSLAYERLNALGDGGENDPEGELYERLGSLAGTQLDPEIVDAVCGRTFMQIPGTVAAAELLAI